jgi:zinc transport system substrate-binding protein
MLIKLGWPRLQQAKVCNTLLGLCILSALTGFAYADTSKTQSAMVAKEQKVTATKGLTLVASIRPLAFLLNKLALPADNVIQLVSNNNSAHHYQLKVSDRRLLQSADLVVWVGPALELFLEKPLKQVAHAGGESVVTLSDTPSLAWLDSAPAETSADDNHTNNNHDNDKQDQHNDHGHDDHVQDKQAHDDHAHDDHAQKPTSNDKDKHAKNAHGDHQHNGRDPHIWLNPINVQAMVGLLAKRLGKLSPEHAAAYQQKAQALIKALGTLDKDIAKQMAGIADKPFTVLHPAYSHFINRYQLNQLDYVVINPESAIGAKHLYELSQYKMACVFGEVGQGNQHIEKIAASAKAKVGQLDPLGSNLADDASIIELIQGLADDFEACLG